MTINLDTFISILEEGIDRHPHLLFEIGYTRPTDYIITIWNAAGVGIKNAPKIVQTQGCNVDDCALQAAVELIKLFDLYDDLQCYISTSCDDLKVSIMDGDCLSKGDLMRLQDYLSTMEGQITRKKLVAQAIKKKGKA